MADKQAFDIEEFAEGVKQAVINSAKNPDLIRFGCSCTTCWTPVTGPGGEIAELPRVQD
jgi:hypothetical protein